MSILVAVLSPFVILGVGIAGTYALPPERSCVKQFVRSGAEKGLVYYVRSRGKLATHVEPEEMILERPFELAGTVDGCMFETGRPVIDVPNTVYCSLSKFEFSYRKNSD